MEKGASRRFRGAHAVYRFFAGVLIMINDGICDAYWDDILGTYFRLVSVKEVENMAIRDYWVYQQRPVAVPWALYIVKEYDKRYPQDTTCIDFTLYHEDIENPTHSVSTVGLHYDTVGAYISDIAITITDNTGMPFTSADQQQLEKSLFRILQDKA